MPSSVYYDSQQSGSPTPTCQPHLDDWVDLGGARLPTHGDEEYTPGPLIDLCTAVTPPWEDRMNSAWAIASALQDMGIGPTPQIAPFIARILWRGDLNDGIGWVMVIFFWRLRGLCSRWPTQSIFALVLASMNIAYGTHSDAFFPLDVWTESVGGGKVSIRAHEMAKREILRGLEWDVRVEAEDLKQIQVKCINKSLCSDRYQRRLPTFPTPEVFYAENALKCVEPLSIPFAGQSRDIRDRGRSGRVRP